MNNRKVDPNSVPSLMLVLEGLAILMMQQGASSQEAVEGASIIFARAHQEATIMELESMMAAGGEFDEE
jgi:hypothetical protein